VLIIGCTKGRSERQKLKITAEAGLLPRRVSRALRIERLELARLRTIVNENDPLGRLGEQQAALADIRSYGAVCQKRPATPHR
jgi:hypothetical protein